ncbi:MAG: anti-phage-associated DUF499 domain-containing protein, partial [Gammaproteobacteria bacterium]
MSDTAASKLVLDVAGQAEMLIQRAEDQLWPQGQHRVRWADVLDRSKTNPRWLWLPPKELEQLRRSAEGLGRWIYTEDGYIDKNPAKAKTSVVVAETQYDDTTGTATLKVTVKNAGAKAVIHYAEDPKVSEKSPVLHELTFETDKTRLFFLAIDPSREHETGEVERWTNRLTITHQPRERGQKRAIELRVVPRGRLRYTLNGANPREGQEYTGAFAIGLEETLIQVFAEDGEVHETRSFRVPKVGQTGPVIDPARPATLKKKLEFSGPAEVFKLLNRAKQGKARLVSPALEVGQGDKAASLRFGSGAILGPEAIESLIGCIRAALAD